MRIRTAIINGTNKRIGLRKCKGDWSDEFGYFIKHPSWKYKEGFLDLYFKTLYIRVNDKKKREDRSFKLWSNKSWDLDNKMWVESIGLLNRFTIRENGKLKVKYGFKKGRLMTKPKILI